MKLKTNFKGFTLVEVLIVIIIVGILIAALLPRLQGSQTRARDTARMGHINQIGSALALAAADGKTALTGCTDLAPWAGSGYLSSIPLDPQGTNGTQSVCGGDAYNVFAVGTKVVALAELELDNGNCTFATISGGTLTVNETAGDSFCVVAQ